MLDTNFLSQELSLNCSSFNRNIHPFPNCSRKTCCDYAGSPIATVLLLHAAAYASDIWKRTGTLQALATSGILAVAVDLPGDHA